MARSFVDVDVRWAAPAGVAVGTLRSAAPADDAREEREVVMEAVTRSGGGLKYAGVGLKEDREVVLEAVKQDWRGCGQPAGS